MTDPVYESPTPDELGVYIGNPVIDAERAALLIGLSESRARMIVDPLPAGAEAIVLSVAARVYTNPLQVTSQVAGPFTVAQAFPGVYLTREDKKDLRRAAGFGGGAFSVDPTIDNHRPFRDATSFPTVDEVEENLMDEGFG